MATSRDTSTSVADRIRHTANTNGSRTAIVTGDRRVSYAELVTLVGAASAYLVANGVRRTDRVVVLGHRTPETIATFLACLSLGMPYVPVDAGVPDKQLAEIVARSGAALVVGTADAGPGVAVPAGVGEWAPSVSTSDDPAYVIFTSGSTGRPRGAAISNANLAAYVDHAIDVFEIRPTDRALQVASLGFDWSVSEIFPALAAGASVVLRSADALHSAQHLVAELRRHDVTMVQLPTAVWHAIVPDLVGDAVDLPAGLRHVTIGAEQATLDAVVAWDKRFGHTGVRLVNSYGPTECTVEATQIDLSGPRGINIHERRVVPIGLPLPGCAVYVLDADLRPLPPNVPGTIFIGGWGVGLGYLDDPDATAERFVADPFATGAARMYDTGDIGQWNDFGELEFLGRADNQVKISGYRVELEDVERRMAAHGSVREVAVTYTKESGTLTAYVVGSGVTADDLRTWFVAEVPPHLVPSRIVFVDDLPRTANDKVDRAALAAPPVAAAVEPAVDSGTEQVIAEVWKRALGLAEVAVTDDFFRLGGHSLMAIRIVGQLNKRGIRVQARDLFDVRTIRGLAELAAAREAAGS